MFVSRYNHILERVHKDNVILHSEGLCLEAVVDSIKSLVEYFKSIHKEFDHFENEALAVFSNSCDDVMSPVYH